MLVCLFLALRSQCLVKCPGFISHVKTTKLWSPCVPCIATSGPALHSWSEGNMLQPQVSLPKKSPEDVHKASVLITARSPACTELLCKF